MNNPFFLIILFLLLLNVVGGNPPLIFDLLVREPLVALSFVAGLVIGITIHEAAHALAAYRLGDPTAKLAGRLTLNPASHLDPIGTIAIFLVGFGWGKPTPFDPFNLRNVKRDSAIISAAGAISNFILAATLSLPYLILFYSNSLTAQIREFYFYLSPVIFLNIVLGVFNLIPIHPLDGFKALAGLLPREWADDFLSTQNYGIIILLLLIFTGLIGKFIFPVVSFMLNLLLPSLRFPF